MTLTATGEYANVTINATANGVYEKLVVQNDTTEHTTQTVTNASPSNPVELVNANVYAKAINSFMVMKIS